MSRECQDEKPGVEAHNQRAFFNHRSSTKVGVACPKKSTE